MNIINHARLSHAFVYSAVCLMFHLIIVPLDERLTEHHNRMIMNVDTVEKLASIYPRSVEQIADWCEAGIQLARLEIDQILAQEVRTFDTTVRALDLSRAKLTELVATFQMLHDLSPDAAIRAAAHQASMKIQQASVDLYMNKQLHGVLEAYHDQDRSGELLTPENTALLQDVLESGKRSGLNLSDESLHDLKQLSKELDEIEHQFLANISNYDAVLEVSFEQLDGVSELVLQRLERRGDRYILPANYPTYRAVLEQCHCAQTRKDMFFMMNNCAYPDNDTLLTQLVQKRDELARLLGYEHFAALDISQTSAQSVAVVETFLTDLIKTALIKAHDEIALLQDNGAQNVTLHENGSFLPWDYLYLVAQHHKKYGNIDEQEIAQYFPARTVVQGVLSIYQDFLGLTFQQVQPVWVWHEDVELFEVHDTSSGQLLGYFYLDLYPRPHKYSHTGCMMPQKSSYQVDGVSRCAVAAIVTNFAPPSADTPGLLSYDAVVTFFHEFGHAMHQILGRAQHFGYSGTSVKPDFVETPSQMFEQWMHEYEFISKVSGHYRTGEPLPENIINQKLALKTSNKGYQTVRQCMLSLFALQLMQKTDLSYQPALLWKKICQQYSSDMVAHVDENHWYASFGHLAASGLYASKYYTYLWTLVFATDLFREIKYHNFDDAYRAKVRHLLGAGGAIDPAQLLHEFLGREPNQDAFLTELGLAL